jgi:hypothetical protein
VEGGRCEFGGFAFGAPVCSAPLSPALAETSATVGLAGDSHYREQSTSHHLRQGILLSSLQACCHAFTLNLTCLRLFRDSQDERLRTEKTDLHLVGHESDKIRQLL